MIFRRIFRRLLGGGNEWSGAKGKKDFHVHVAPDETISGECAICGSALQVDEDEQTIWFACETCGRQAFYGTGDAARDRRRAAETGEPVTLGLYYYDQLPAAARPPRRSWD